MTKAKENGDEEAIAELEDFINLIQNGQENNGVITILMNKHNSIYYVPCKINGVKADFIFDTGASAISLSSSFAEQLIDLGKLSRNDYLGDGSSTIADGSSQSITFVNIKDVEIGGLHLYNVRAAIREQQNAPLLLGQSALEKLGKYTIDGYRLIIHRE